MSPDLESERLRLAEISGWYSNRDWGFYTKLVHMGFRSLQPYFVTGSMLEVGCADGEMTRFLLDVFADLSVLDAAPGYVHAATALDPRIHGHVAMIQEWQPSRRYDNVLFAHVLEHVTAPVEILGKLAGLLTEAGRIFIIVPNALSLHRLAGVAMGMLERPTDLNEADISVGHRRVYTTDTLREDIRRAGLDIVAWGGIFLKPLANKQIEEQWSDELIEAYFQLGKNRPDLCSELFAVCRPRR